jgi:hypothetical protein
MPADAEGRRKVRTVPAWISERAGQIVIKDLIIELTLIRKSPLAPAYRQAGLFSKEGALFLPCLKHLLLVGKGRAGGIL